MKKYCFCLLLVFAGTVAFAQKAVMMGRVTDGNGKPVAGAELKVTGHRVYYKMTTDNDGVYNTPMIEAISYHVIIDANGKYYTCDKVKVSKQTDGKEVYNFTLGQGDANLHIEDATDPAMIARIEMMEADYNKTQELSAAKKDATETGEVARVPTNDRKEDAPVKRNNNTSVKIIPGEKVPQQDK